MRKKHTGKRSAVQECPPVGPPYLPRPFAEDAFRIEYLADRDPLHYCCGSPAQPWHAHNELLQVFSFLTARGHRTFPWTRLQRDNCIHMFPIT